MGGVMVSSRGPDKGQEEREGGLALPQFLSLSTSIDEECSLFPPFTFGKPSLRPSSDKLNLLLK